MVLFCFDYKIVIISANSFEIFTDYILSELFDELHVGFLFCKNILLTTHMYTFLCGVTKKLNKLKIRFV